MSVTNALGWATQRKTMLFGAIVFTMAWRPVASTLMKSTVIYTNAKCDGTPVYMILAEDENCATERTLCTSDGEDVGAQYIFTSCIDTERHEHVANVFGEFSYVMLDVYNENGCKSLYYSQAFLAAGICQRAGSGNHSFSSNVLLYPNGSTLLQLFDGPTCGGESTTTLRPTASDISSHICVGKLSRFFTNTSPTNTSGSSSFSANSSTDGSISSTIKTSDASTGLSTGEIIGIVVGSIVFALLVVAVLIWRHRSESERWNPSEAVESPVDCDDSKLNPSYMSNVTERGTMAAVHVPRGSSMPYRENFGVGGVWDDEAIVAVRIPRSKVLVHELISRDGYAAVFKGIFNGQLVTVKSLLPQTRNNIECMTNFCSDVKMMTTMDHPRIAQLIGVAWDSRTDVCVVSEYLDGGDLRGLLDSFAQLNHPVGFDYDKVKIALHIAHALTYLHSLEPPVIHRNLKPKNMLLTYELDAKLTDFGISREQMDTTMTSGVGSALWMAPEVVMGHRYDEKADIFSFGVVLSELDLLPYSHAEAQNNSRHKMPESLILQQMVAGKLQVEFSQRGSGSAQELGKARVAVDPNHKPTAAEVLYKLHTILTREM